MSSSWRGSSASRAAGRAAGSSRSSSSPGWPGRRTGRERRWRSPSCSGWPSRRCSRSTAPSTSSTRRWAGPTRLFASAVSNASPSVEPRARRSCTRHASSRVSSGSAIRWRGSKAAVSPRSAVRRMWRRRSAIVGRKRAPAAAARCRPRRAGSCSVPPHRHRRRARERRAARGKGGGGVGRRGSDPLDGARGGRRLRHRRRAAHRRPPGPRYARCPWRRCPTVGRHRRRTSRHADGGAVATVHRTESVPRADDGGRGRGVDSAARSSSPARTADSSASSRPSPTRGAAGPLPGRRSSSLRARSGTGRRRHRARRIHCERLALTHLSPRPDLDRRCAGLDKADGVAV